METKTVLGLLLPTDPRWANVAAMNIADILIDHAYCEQKAASSCISLIVQYPEFEKVAEVLSPVVIEEWNHFQMVLQHLKKRGFTLGKQREDIYIQKLSQHIKKGNNRTHQLVEKLLVNALIEARSCERFKLLHTSIRDEELQSFYYELMISEALHYKNFIELAESIQNKKIVAERWKEWLIIEASIIENLTPRGDRMH